MSERITDAAHRVLVAAGGALTARDIAERIGGVSAKSVAVGCTCAGHGRIEVQYRKNHVALYSARVDGAA
jgi:hypothetical protein